MLFSIKDNLTEKSRHGLWRDHLIAGCIAASGGMLGIGGAFLQEAKSGFLVPFVAAPIIEESLKPCGLYFLLGKWPRLLRNQLYTAFLTAIGGLSFAIVENLVYLYIYFPQHTHELVIYRFTVNLFVHSLASFIFGFGINERLLASVRGEIPFLTGSKKFFTAAILLHTLYNIGAFVSQVTGLLKI